MKRVSFEVAKAIKEVGYPQPQTDVWGYVNRPNNCYFTGSHSYWDEYRERRLKWDETNEFHTADDWADEIEPSFYGSAIAAPTYLEVWLWLWREKHCYIQTDLCFRQNNESAFICIDKINNVELVGSGSQDPEEAIIAAIEYLVENNLIIK